jgi:hypothetical protein
MTTDTDRPEMLDGTGWVLFERELIAPCREAPFFPSVAYTYVEVYEDWEGRASGLKHEEHRDKFIDWLQSMAEYMADRDEMIDPDGDVRLYLSNPINEFVAVEQITSAAKEWEFRTDVEFVDELPIDESEQEDFYKEVVDTP